MAELTFYNSIPSDLKTTTTFGVGCLVIKGCINVYDISPATETVIHCAIHLFQW